ncbi:MAG: sulfite exporter TauE/SafE family protein [Gulosibacter sp.]|uniref:sulfite exporter TauE/SafE family protein n=1 Tax=Gulosibacter sp. TaxID=2817531 RepID=UPI003F8F64D3
MNLIVIPIAVLVGLLIGAIGVGGIALPPALVWLVGTDPHTAAGTASWSFLFTGIMGTIMYGRRKAMPWLMVGMLTLGACPGALLGALANGLLPDSIALLPLAAFTLAAGVYHLVFRSRNKRSREHLPTATAIAVGAVVGFCSALTGTGGPVFLIPVLLALGIPAITAIAAAQVIQLPLVVFAVAGYAAQGAVDFGLGSIVGVLAAVGVIGGAAIALKLKAKTLHLVTSVSLVGFGVLIGILQIFTAP